MVEKAEYFRRQGPDKIAVLVDGGFFQKRAQHLWGSKTPEQRVEELMTICHKHQCTRQGIDYLYRIFYYDCPPSSKSVYHPLLKKTVDLSKSISFTWMNTFHELLRSKRKVALRLGELSTMNLAYRLQPRAIKQLCTKNITVDDLTEKDFILNIEQKGVDMRIGVDIASMAFKKQVTKMILISGDSDFVPAAKLARREGIDFVLNPMWSRIKNELNEHIDGLTSPNPYKKAGKGEILECEILHDELEE